VRAVFCSEEDNAVAVSSVIALLPNRVTRPSDSSVTGRVDDSARPFPGQRVSIAANRQLRLAERPMRAYTPIP
jgi:hypothetical protein